MQLYGRRDSPVLLLICCDGLIADCLWNILILVILVLVYSYELFKKFVSHHLLPPYRIQVTCIIVVIFSCVSFCISLRHVLASLGTPLGQSR